MNLPPYLFLAAVLLALAASAYSQPAAKEGARHDVRLRFEAECAILRWKALFGGKWKAM